MSSYVASKNRSQGREGWCVTFRHPLRRDAEDRPLRIRRGLGTRDDEEADRLVGQMNVLLSDETYWQLSSKPKAAAELDARVVELFYEDIESRTVDPWLRRDQLLPLPGPSEGYSRIQVVGPTGAGKTTLLRQLIGTDPRKERFPSTSTAKTTTFDAEIVLDPGPTFRAIVSFLPRDRVRSYVEDCVAAAVVAAVSGKQEQAVARRLLEHHEQRFRLSYLLGSLSPASPSAGGIEPDEQDQDLLDDGLLDDGLLDDGLLDDGMPSANDSDSGGEAVEVDRAERQRLTEVLRGFLARIRLVADEIAPRVARELDIDPTELTADDGDVFLEFVEDAVARDAEARALVDDLMSEIVDRVDLLETGSLERDGGDWPLSWHWESDDRALFIRTINRFSSNYAPNFGRLLAPIVHGMRIAGPFRPAWTDPTEECRFVFIDGEGLGHTPASAASLPTSITRRYDTADVILLVDNAAQPMQASAQAVLRSVAAGGHDGKVAIAFTHFDQVVGDNLPTVRARHQHVHASLDSTLRAVEDALGSGAGARLRRRLEGRVVMVSNIQDPLQDRNRLTLKSFRDLRETFRRAIVPAEVDEVAPVYDVANLVVAVERSAEQFHKHWSARLGLAFEAGVPREHWAKVKALTRRLAYQWEDEYRDLKPVADLIKFISERLAAFLAAPRAWKPANCTEAAKEEAVDRVSREVFARLHKLAEDRLLHDQLAGWLTAYELRGTGSTRPRARKIVEIYETAAPVLAEVPGMASTDFLDAFRHLFIEATTAAGAEIVA